MEVWAGRRIGRDAVDAARTPRCVDDRPAGGHRRDGGVGVRRGVVEGHGEKSAVGTPVGWTMTT